MDKLKLNYKRTIFVGFAFFLISLFWQAYDSIIPKILTDKFGMSQFWSGVIMAFDNIIALFLLPLFGTLSDKCKSKHGRRTPFILVGTIVAAVALVGLSFVDAAQLRKLEPITAVTDSESEGYKDAMTELYRSDVEFVLDGGERITLSDKFTEEEFVGFADECREKLEADRLSANGDGKLGLSDNTEEIDLDNDSAEYKSFVATYLTPARQAYAAQVVDAAPSAVIVFISVLMVVLLSMAIFRSPAVALMPDVTPKPLRSKGNAIINLMGVFGGILVLVLGILFGTGNPQNALMKYTVFFAVVAACMLVALLIFKLKVNEPKLVQSMQEESRELGIIENEDDGNKKASTGKLSRPEFCSLMFILFSVVFWYMGYNAITSKYSVYAGAVLQLDYNMTLIIAQGAALITYIPVGIIASRIGRKKTILFGVACLTIAVALGSLFKAGANIWLINAVFALAGVGWATINVNSYPMVVELASHGNVGKYTGFYYTASMSAQTLTPMLSGFFMDSFGMRTLFPYAAIFVGLSFVTMLFVRHGDSRPVQKKTSIEALDVD